MVQSEGNISLKNPVTLPGMDPGTVRLVAPTHAPTKPKVVAYKTYICVGQNNLPVNIRIKNNENKSS
jgi:hypothetical protein